MSDDYDRAIHHNPDAKAWAAFFFKTAAECGWNLGDIDEELMHTWFANAMMAMHDFLAKPQPAPAASGDEELRLLRELETAVRGWRYGRVHSLRGEDVDPILDRIDTLKNKETT